MTEEEIEEYFKIGRELKRVLSKLFKPDLFNYATLANVAIHLHTHIIPRYKSKREFLGIIFTDEKWGQNYAPYRKDFKLSEEQLIKLRDALKREINSIN